jgi:hypothetical protein
MRVTTKWDRDAVKDWIEGCGDPEKGTEVLNSLAQMKRGDAWAWSPEVEFGPKRIHFEMFKTYDSFRPQSSSDAAKLKGWADVDLAEVKKKLEHVVKETEANDPAKLKARIYELQKELKAKQPAGKPVEVKVADEKAIARAVMTATKQYRDQLAAMAKALRMIGTGAEQIATLAARHGVTNFEPPKVSGAEISRKESTLARPLPRPAAPRPEISGDGPKLKAGAVKMLTILAQWHPDPRTRDQLGALAGFAPAGGTFSEYLSALRTNGYIAENGDGVHITEEGLSAVPHVPARPDSPDQLVALWKSKFKAGVGKMLDVLVTDYPGYITREELGERSGFAHAGGTFIEYLSALRRARLIEESGSTVRAAESLMEI